MNKEVMVEVRTPDWKDRAAEELNELKARRERLRKFIDGPKFSSIDLVDQRLLRFQYSAMGVYEDILAQRIDWF